MSTELHEFEQEPKRSGRRAAAPVDASQHKPSTGRRALVLDDSFLHDDEPETGRSTDDKPLLSDSRVEDASTSVQEVVEVPVEDAESPEAEPTSEDQPLTRRDRARRIVRAAPLVEGDIESDPRDDYPEETAARKSSEGISRTNLLIIAVADMIAIAVFFFISFVVNGGSFSFSVVALGAAALIVVAAFVVVAARIQKQKAEANKPSGEMTLHQHEDVEQ